MPLYGGPYGLDSDYPLYGRGRTGARLPYDPFSFLPPRDPSLPGPTGPPAAPPLVPESGPPTEMSLPPRPPHGAPLLPGRHTTKRTGLFGPFAMMGG